jgi:hypothetical protein
MPYTFEQFIGLPIADLQLLGEYGKKFSSVFVPGEPIAATIDLLRKKVKEQVTIQKPV